MDDGSGMTPAPESGAAGAVSSQDATRKKPKQGLRSGMKVDQNKHGIRRETSLDAKPKRTGRKKV